VEETKSSLFIDTPFRAESMVDSDAVHGREVRRELGGFRVAICPE